MEKLNKILVEVKDGEVQGVYSEEQCDIIIIDYDVCHLTSEKYRSEADKISKMKDKTDSEKKKKFEAHRKLYAKKKYIKSLPYLERADKTETGVPVKKEKYRSYPMNDDLAQEFL